MISIVFILLRSENPSLEILLHALLNTYTLIDFERMEAIKNLEKKYPY
jgi:hypothetical protein